MLRLVNLSVDVNAKRVLTNVSLYVREGETLALFGPNGSGKSTLMNAIIGNPKYKITEGRIIFKKHDITRVPTDERVKLGLGIAFQSPPAISGIKLIDLLKKIAEIRGTEEEKIYEYAKKLKMEEHLEREINRGFSGGEMKRSELLQLLVMNPDFVMLDEPDSGVDLENIGIVGKAIRELLERDKEKREKAGIIITHTGHILDYVDADYGAILYRGRIACIGDPYEILEDVREFGYEGCVEKCLTKYGNLNLRR